MKELIYFEKGSFSYSKYRCEKLNFSKITCLYHLIVKMVNYFLKYVYIEFKIYFLKIFPFKNNDSNNFHHLVVITITIIIPTTQFF